MKFYSIRKCKNILKSHARLYKRRRKRLSSEISEKIKFTLVGLQDALLHHNRSAADKLAKEAEYLSKTYLKRSLFQRMYEGVFALSFALLIAIVIRQTAFELYEIPTGSMRPTFKEQDRLVVSKTQFGLNIPLTTSHLMFKQDEVKRMGVVVFTGKNMDISGVKTRYFYLFPGYKQYIKRMIGLPGDTLYFYGGKIYGIDEQGNDISSTLQLPELSYVEHIPYINLEGKVQAPRTPIKDIFSPVIIRQMNLPIAKLYLSSKKDVHYEMIYHPNTEDTTNSPKDLHQIWGIDNFAQVRLVQKDFLQKTDPGAIQQFSSADYYLEFTHHPSIAKANLQRDPYHRLRPMVSTDKSYIPLNDEQQIKLWSQIYTGRFIVENGSMRRYGVSRADANKNQFTPKLKGNIPNGTYEFYQGKLYEVKAQGITKLAASNHPLAQFDKAKLYLFFNAGIECDTRFLPNHKIQGIIPARYAYFNDGDLFIMGAPILKKNDSTLQSYVTTEMAKEQKSSKYAPFVDLGPPLLNDGTLDIVKIKTLGLKIPEKQYLVLGDNHAMSGDSREFGFVPECNIRGTPSFMFWASGGRFGFPKLSVYPLITTPRTIVWTILGITGVIYWFRHHRRRKPPISFD